MCEPACAHVYVFMYMHACMYACMYGRMHMCIRTYRIIHKHTHGYIRACPYKTYDIYNLYTNIICKSVFDMKSLLWAWSLPSSRHLNKTDYSQGAWCPETPAGAEWLHAPYPRTMANRSSAAMDNNTKRIPRCRTGSKSMISCNRNSARPLQSPPCFQQWSSQCSQDS